MNVVVSVSIGCKSGNCGPDRIVSVEAEAFAANRVKGRGTIDG
ncbi:hypothetical protein [Neoaquamicrobium microcysteis]|nr:hypothetical protein [Mesorhizobium microcysteis]